MLKKCKIFFEKIEEKKIKYCHWKSNEHLKEGLIGITDLDILIEKEKYNEVSIVLMKLGFKRGKSIFYLSYPSIEDYIGFDEKTGRMIHLHLHYELMIGKKFIKGVRLPWEKKIYDTLKIDDKHNINIIDPNIELLLLLMRNNLKINFMRKLKGSMLSKDENIEFQWLKDKINMAEILKLSTELLNEELGKHILEYILKENKKNYKKMNRSMDLFYKKINNYSNWVQTIKYSYLKLNAAVKYVLNKKLKQPILYRRGLPEGGLIISFIGVDGSGKSTLINETKKWLSWKIDIYQMYFGSGDGECSLLRRPLKLINDMRSKKRGNSLNLTENKNDKIKKTSKMKMAKVLWALTLAIEKKTKMYKILKARNQGMIVLTDRYPQTQFEGYNDGPLLREWKDSQSNIKRKISEWEYNIYRLSEEIYPDIVFKLLISEEISASRKDDTPLYMIRKKIETIKKLEFPTSKVYEVVTEGSLEVNSLKIKNMIWSNLNGK